MDQYQSFTENFSN